MWVEASESALRSGAHMELTAFIAAHLVPFLKGATERLGQVSDRHDLTRSSLLLISGAVAAASPS